MLQPPELNPLALVAGFALGVLWLAANKKLFNDILSPFSVLLFCWVGPLILQAGNLSSLEQPWAPRNAFITLWVTVALTGPCLITAWSLRDKPFVTPQHRSEFERLNQLLRDGPIIASFLALFVVSFGAYIYTEFITNPYGVPLLSIISEGPLATHSAHRWGKDTRWAIFSGLLYVLAPLGFLAAKANRGRPKLSYLLYGTAFALPVMAVLKLSRSDVFVTAIAITIVARYSRIFGAGERAMTLSRGLRLAIAGLAIVLVYYGMMAVRTGPGLGDLYASLIGFRVGSDGPLAFLTGPAAAIYGYVAMPFDNLNRFLTSHPWSELHPGISVTRPVLSVVGLGDLADRLNTAVYYPLPATFAAGSATFLTGVYAEGGILGAALIPIVYSSILNFSYYGLRSRPSLWTMLLYANFAYPWAWLFFNNGMGVLTIYLNAGFILVLMLLTVEFWRKPGRQTLQSV